MKKTAAGLRLNRRWRSGLRLDVHGTEASPNALRGGDRKALAKELGRHVR